MPASDLVLMFALCGLLIMIAVNASEMGMMFNSCYDVSHDAASGPEPDVSVANHVLCPASDPFLLSTYCTPALCGARDSREIPARMGADSANLDFEIGAPISLKTLIATSKVTVPGNRRHVSRGLTDEIDTSAGTSINIGSSQSTATTDPTGPLPTRHQINSHWAEAPVPERPPSPLSNVIKAETSSARGRKGIAVARSTKKTKSKRRPSVRPQPASSTCEADYQSSSASSKPADSERDPVGLDVIEDGVVCDIGTEKLPYDRIVEMLDSFERSDDDRPPGGTAAQNDTQPRGTRYLHDRVVPDRIQDREEFFDSVRRSRMRTDAIANKPSKTSQGPKKARTQLVLHKKEVRRSSKPEQQTSDSFIQPRTALRARPRPRAGAVINPVADREGDTRNERLAEQTQTAASSHDQRRVTFNLDIDTRDTLVDQLFGISPPLAAKPENS